jgi:hypothetical protein
MDDGEKSFVVLLLFALLWVLGIGYWIHELPNPRLKAWIVLIESSIFLGVHACMHALHVFICPLSCVALATGSFHHLRSTIVDFFFLCVR